MIKNYIIGIVVLLSLLMIFGLFNSSITGNVIHQKEPDKVIIYFPNTADFPNTEQGTIVFDFSLPAGFKVGNKTVDILMFLNSNTLPGLKIGYDIVGQKIYAGLPLMPSQPVTILDNQRHKLVYMFNRASKKQSIFVDDKLLAEGEFTGNTESNVISGFAVYQQWKWIESPIPIDVHYE